MKDKQAQDALVSAVIGAIVAWAAGKFVLTPIFGETAWWLYVLVFLIFAGSTMEALRKDRIQDKLAYDKGVAVKPVEEPVAGNVRHCTQCGSPVASDAKFCAKCGQPLRPL